MALGHEHSAMSQQVHVHLAVSPGVSRGPTVEVSDRSASVSRGAPAPVDRHHDPKRRRGIRPPGGRSHVLIVSVNGISSNLWNINLQ